MKILHVYKDYDPVVGGIENHIKTLAEGQAAAGHQVTVLVTNTRARTLEEDRGGVRIIKAARLGRLASTPLSFRLATELRRLEADITHLHFPYPVGELSHHLVGRSSRSVLTYHCDIVRQQRLLVLYRPLLSRILARVDRIIVSTPALLEGGAMLAPVRERCRIIEHGVSRARFLEPQPVRAAAIRARHGGGPLVLFVGVQRYYKGVQYLLRAMVDVPGATLVVVGEGPMAAAWRAEARGLGLGPRAAFAGRVPDADLPAYYQAADLFVLPASERAEAFGLVQLEAMASGLPVVCTELGTGTSEVNRHRETGLVVPPRDPTALAGAMRALLADHALRRRLGQGARARSSEFTAERMVSRVLRLYEDILTDGPVPARAAPAAQA